MKKLLVVGGSLLGVIAIFAVALWFIASNWPRISTELEPDIKVNTADRARSASATLATAKDAYERWVALGDVALWLAEPATADEARNAANELLGLATNEYPTDWNYGNAIHKANSGLGRLALQKGEKAAAREYLLASARSKGSPQMNSFGPNMMFASEMVAAGETEAVIEYLTMCGTFWKLERGRLDLWKQEVKEGRSPKFGANLLY